MPTPVKEAALKRFGPVLYEFYAATETLIITNIAAKDMLRKKRSVGPPAWDVFHQAFGRARQARFPMARWARYISKCPSLFSGYFRDPEKTAEAFKDGWFTLGDMGRLDEDGYLYIVDRRTDMVISGGENIYPSEVEEVLLRHPKVAEAAVIGVPDSHLGRGSQGGGGAKGWSEQQL